MQFLHRIIIIVVVVVVMPISLDNLQTDDFPVIDLYYEWAEFFFLARRPITTMKIHYQQIKIIPFAHTQLEWYGIRKTSGKK